MRRNRGALPFIIILAMLVAEIKTFAMPLTVCAQESDVAVYAEETEDAILTENDSFMSFGVMRTEDEESEEVGIIPDEADIYDDTAEEPDDVSEEEVIYGSQDMVVAEDEPEPDDCENDAPKLLQASKYDLSGYNSSNDYYYKQLNADEKKFYDDIKKVCEELYYGNGEPVAHSYEHGYWYSYGHINYDSSKIDSDAFQKVEEIFTLSEPKYFFLPRLMSRKDAKGSYAILQVNPECGSRVKLDQYREKIESLSYEWLKETDKISDPIEKEEYLIKKLVDQLDYGYIDYDGERHIDEMGTGKTNQLNCCTIAGAFGDRICVCSGTARATAYLLNMAGIECIVATSPAHVWNYVKLYGEWYCLDVTWTESSARRSAGGKGTDSEFIDWNGYCINKSQATFDKNGAVTGHIPENEFADWGIELPEAVSDVVNKSSEESIEVVEDVITIGKDAATLKEAFNLISTERKRGIAKESYTIDIGDEHTETKAVTTPAGDFTVIIKGGILKLASPTVTAKCSLVVDCNPVSTSGKKINFNVKARRMLSINKEISGLGNIVGTKSSSLNTGADVICENLRNFGSVDTSDHVFAVNKKTAGIGSLKGIFKAGSVTTVTNVDDATIYVTKSNAKKTVVNGVNIFLKIVYENDDEIPSGTQLLKYTGKNDVLSKLAVGNTGSGGRELNAYLYGKKLKAVDPQALTLSVWSDEQNRFIQLGHYRDFDEAFAAANGKSGICQIYLAGDVCIEKLSLPKKRGLVLSGAGTVLDCGTTKKLSTNNYLCIYNLKLIAGGNSVSIKSGGRNNLYLKDTEVKDVTVTRGVLKVNGNVTVSGTAKVYGLMTDEDGSVLKAKKLILGKGGMYDNGKTLKVQ